MASRVNFSIDTNVSTLSAAEIATLSPAEVQSFSRAQREQLSVTQAAGLTDKQLAVFNTQNVDSGVFSAIPTKAISGLNVSNLTPEQFSALTPQQIGVLKATQTQKITAQQLKNADAEIINAFSLTKGGGFEGLNVRHISDVSLLDSSHVSALSAKQLNSQLTTTQILQFSATQTAALTKAQAAIIMAKFIAALSDEGISGLSSDFVSAVTPKALAGLSAGGNLDALTENQLLYFTADQIKNFSFSQINALSNSGDLEYLSTAAIAGLNQNNIKGLNVAALKGDGQFAALTPNQIKHFTTLQIATINSEMAPFLTSADIAALNANQVAKLSVTEVIANLPETAVAGFNAKNASGITGEQLAAFSEEQIAQLKPAAISRLQANVINSLEPEDFAYLKPETVKAISVNEISGSTTNGSTGINPAAFANATPEQIKAMTPAQFAKLNSAQISQFGSEQAGAISAGQLAKVNADLTNYFSSAVISDLPATAISQLRLSSFTSQQVAQLTPEQAAKLTVAQLKALNPSTGILGLNAEHVQNNNIKSLSGLSQSQIQALKYSASTDVIPALSTAQLNKFKPTEIEYLTVNQVNALDDGVKTWATEKKGYIMINGTNLTTTVNSIGATNGTPGFEANSRTVTIAGGSPAVVTGGRFDDIINVTDAGAHTVYGGAGHDTITGGTSTDSIQSGLGNDKIIMAGNLTNLDAIDGGLGYDVLTYTATAASNLNNVQNVEEIILATTVADSAITTLDLLVASGKVLKVDASDLIAGANDELNFDGSAEKDGMFSVIGSAGSDTMQGGSGNDTLDGGDSSDAITGNAGNDLLIGGNGGSDTFTGGAGNDTLVASAGSDGLIDTFNIDAGTDTLTGLGAGSSSDVVVVSTGAVLKATLGGAWTPVATTTYNNGSATVEANGYAVNLSALNNAVNTSSNGWKIQNSSSTAVSLKGTDLNDTIIGSIGEDKVIMGGLGLDVLVGGDGNDTFWFDAVAGKTNHPMIGNYDAILDFTPGKDKIKFINQDDQLSNQQATIESKVAALPSDASEATIANTMALWNTDDTADSFASLNGSTYVLFQSTGADTTFNVANDVFVKLVGITISPTIADISGVLLNTITTDNIINIAERAAGVTISGTADPLQTITFTTVNGTGSLTSVSGTTSVNAAGTWSRFFSGSLTATEGTVTIVATDTLTETGRKTVTIDLTSPTITAFSSTKPDGSYKSGDTIPIAATASENMTSGTTITATLDTGDTVTLTANGTTSLTGTYTVGAGDTSSDLTVASFAVGTATDIALNPIVVNTVPVGLDIGTVKAIVIDTTAPAHTGGTIVLADTALKAGETSLVTFTFPEPVTNFSNTDVTAPNGTMTAVSSADGGTTWTATFTPSVNTTDATNVITVNMTTLTDIAGNAGTGTLSSGNYSIDTLAPAHTGGTIVLADATLKAGETSLVTFTFPEAVTSFDNTDVTIDNGTMTAVSSADGGITWTATFTPSANIEDTSNVISVDMTTLTDIAGNAGTGTLTSGNYSIDTLVPTAVSITLTDNGGSTVGTGDTGDNLVLTFSEAVGNKSAVEDLFDLVDAYGDGSGRATTAWSVGDTVLTVTLGTNETIGVVTGTSVILNGVQDVAANSANLTFTFA